MMTDERNTLRKLRTSAPPRLHRPDDQSGARGEEPQGRAGNRWHQRPRRPRSHWTPEVEGRGQGKV
eukprot:2540329-Alexandrium_andersonii.AAC.1